MPITADYTTTGSVMVNLQSLFRADDIDVDVTFDIDADYLEHDDYNDLDVYTAYPIVSRVEIVNHANGARLDVTQYVDRDNVADALIAQSLAYWEAAEAYVDDRYRGRLYGAEENIQRLRLASVVQEVA